MPDSRKSRAEEERALAAERDRQIRLRSVANDTFLNLPVSVPRPDGEVCHRRTSTQTRSYDPQSEITRQCIQGPPNRTIYETQDWKRGGPAASSCTCSKGESHSNGKSSSTGQLSGWGLSWSRSGKSPPSHGRSRCHHHQRHSHPSNSKNCSASSSSVPGCKHKSSASSSSSTCSSTSSSTSSSTGLLAGGVGIPVAGVCGGRGGKPSSTGLSIGEKLSEKVQQCATTMASGSRGSASNNNASTPSVFSRLIEESFKSSATRSSGRSSKGGKSTSTSEYPPDSSPSTSKSFQLGLQSRQQYPHGLSVHGNSVMPPPNMSPSSMCVAVSPPPSNAGSRSPDCCPVVVASSSPVEISSGTTQTLSKNNRTVFPSFDSVGTAAESRQWCINSNSMSEPESISWFGLPRSDRHHKISDSNGNAGIGPLLGEPNGDNLHRLIEPRSSGAGSGRGAEHLERRGSGRTSEPSGNETVTVYTNSSCVSESNVHECHSASPQLPPSSDSLDMIDAHDDRELVVRSNPPNQYCAKNLSSPSPTSKLSDQTHDLPISTFASDNS